VVFFLCNVSFSSFHLFVVCRVWRKCWLPTLTSDSGVISAVDECNACMRATIRPSFLILSSQSYQFSSFHMLSTRQQTKQLCKFVGRQFAQSFIKSCQTTKAVKLANQFTIPIPFHLPSHTSFTLTLVYLHSSEQSTLAHQ